MAERDVIAALGKPSGLFVPPKVARPARAAIVYAYPETRGASTTVRLIAFELDADRVIRAISVGRSAFYPTAEKARELGPRADASAQRFNLGWPRLRSGMSAGEVYELLGAACGLDPGTLAAAIRSQGGASYEGSSCALSFDRNGLREWKLKP